MTNAQRVAGLIMMAVFLGLLVFVRTMWESGRLTYALIGLVVALVILGIGIAFWRNSDVVIGFFQGLPTRIGNFLENHWAALIGLVLMAGIIYVGGSMLWSAAKVAVGYEDILTQPIASPITQIVPASMDEVFRGKASRIVIYKDRPAEYSVGPNLQADFTPEGNRSQLVSWEEKRGADKVRFYDFQAGTNPGIDSMIVRVCEYPATIETAVCNW